MLAEKSLNKMFPGSIRSLTFYSLTSGEPEKLFRLFINSDDKLDFESFKATETEEKVQRFLDEFKGSPFYLETDDLGLYLKALHARHSIGSYFWSRITDDVG